MLVTLDLLALQSPSCSIRGRVRSRLTSRDDMRALTPPSPWHLKPGLALAEMQCPPVANGLPHWDCVMHRCANCPAYPVPAEEQGINDNAPKIKFHIYQTVTECTKHGVIASGAKVCAQCQADPSPPAKKAPKVCYPTQCKLALGSQIRYNLRPI